MDEDAALRVPVDARSSRKDGLAQVGLVSQMEVDLAVTNLSTAASALVPLIALDLALSFLGIANFDVDCPRPATVENVQREVNAVVGRGRRILGKIDIPGKSSDRLIPGAVKRRLPNR